MTPEKSKPAAVPSKLRVGVVFGGRSAEHEVSLVSAASIINALDKSKYDVIPIGITTHGKWISSPDVMNCLREHGNGESLPGQILLADPSLKGLVAYSPQSSQDRTPLDVIFPVLHGTFGEDGTIQGLFELAGIPYVGAGVLGSAVGMDKVVTKQLCERANIPIAQYIWFTKDEYSRDRRRIVQRIESQIKYPCFVKPANSGSSIGISKAHDKEELLAAVELASQYDLKILVEKGIDSAREIELSVLGNDDASASAPGEIISSNEFYDYDAKYVDGKSAAMIPAALPKGIVKKLQEYAVRAFRVLGCSGMARVDFLVRKRSMQIYLNEINTIPGFTSISMYPKLWEASGLPYTKLLDRLIELAIERFQARQQLRTTYVPKSEWYKKE